MDQESTIYLRECEDARFKFVTTDAHEGDACDISKSSIAAYKSTTRKRSMCSWRTLEYIDKDGEVVALRMDCAGVVDKCHDSDFISEEQSL